MSAVQPVGLFSLAIFISIRKDGKERNTKVCLTDHKIKIERKEK